MQSKSIQFFLNYPLNYEFEKRRSLSFLDNLAGLVCFTVFSFLTLGGLAIYQFYNRMIRPKKADLKEDSLFKTPPILDLFGRQALKKPMN